jgi:PKD repeat protein
VVVLLAAAGLMAGSLDCGHRRRAGTLLEPQYGTLEVRSDPAGAAILVDGADYGSVTPDDFTLSAGPHRVSVSLAGHTFSPASTTLAVPAEGAIAYTFLEYAPVLEPDTTSHAFGTQALSTSSADWCFSVRNSGRAPADSGAFTLAGADAGQYAIVSGGTYRDLAPGASQSVCVAFRPLRAGVAHASVQVGSTTVALSGTGYKVPCDLSPGATAHDFGEQEAGTPYPGWCFDVTNHDAATCTDTLRLGGADAAEFAILSGAEIGLAPEASQTVCVAFLPAGAGARSATLTVGTTVVTLTGTGTGTCALSAPTTPDGTAFGDVCAESVARRRLVIANSGNLACTVSATGCADVAVTPVSATVAAGGSATFEAAFQPSAPGPATACPVTLSDGSNQWTTTFTGRAISVPLADFSPSGGVAGHAGSAIPFVAQVQANGSPVTGYAWDFGDGGTSTLAQPTHRFASGGSYTVSLTVTNACGASPVIAHTVCVDELAYVEIFQFDASSVPSYTTNIPGWGSAVPLVLYRGVNAGYAALSQVVCTNVFTGERLDAKRNAQTNAFEGASEALGTAGQSFSTARLPVSPAECSVTSNFTIGSPTWTGGPTFYLKVGACAHQNLGIVSGSPPGFCIGLTNTYHCGQAGFDGRLEWGLEIAPLARWCSVNSVRFTYDCWYVCPGSGPQTGPLQVVDSR